MITLKQIEKIAKDSGKSKTAVIALGKFLSGEDPKIKVGGYYSKTKRS